VCCDACVPPLHCTTAHTQAVPIIVADAGDSTSLAAMAARTDVIISTAGPFAKYGDKVVEAAVAQGSHYCDITGALAQGGGVIRSCEVCSSGVCRLRRTAWRCTHARASPCTRASLHAPATCVCRAAVCRRAGVGEAHAGRPP
jgi:hypothetical protein